MTVGGLVGSGQLEGWHNGGCRWLGWVPYYVHRGSNPEQTLSKRIMTQQQLLQNARGVLVGMNDAQRQCLKTAAVAAGRKPEAVAKAGTMRLALWVSKGTSAI